MGFFALTLVFLGCVSLGSGSTNTIINDPVNKLVSLLLQGPGEQRLVYGLAHTRSPTITRVLKKAHEKVKTDPKLAAQCRLWWGDDWWEDNWWQLFLTIDDYNDQGIGFTPIMESNGASKRVLSHLKKLAAGTSTNAMEGLPAPVGIHFIRTGLAAWEKSKTRTPSDWFTALYGVKSIDTAKKLFTEEKLAFFDRRKDVRQWASLLSKYRGYVGLQDFGEGSDPIETMRGKRIDVTGFERLKAKSHSSKNMFVSVDWTDEEVKKLAALLAVQSVQSAAKLYLALDSRMRLMADYWVMLAFFRRTSKLGIRFATSTLNGLAFNEAGAVFHEADKSFVNIDVFRESRPQGIKEALDLVDQARQKAITSSEWKLAKAEHSRFCGKKCITFYSEGHDVKKHSKLKAAAAYYNKPQILDETTGKLKKAPLLNTKGLKGLGLEDDGVKKVKSMLEKLFGSSDDETTTDDKKVSKKSDVPPLPRVAPIN